MPSSSTRRQRARSLLVDLTPLRLDRDFRWLWLGQLVSGVGRQITIVALAWELFSLTGTSLSIGLLALVQLVPILTFALGGGAIADALDRRRVLLVTQLFLAGTSAAFLGLALMPEPPVWAFYVVAFFAAGIGAIDQPARSSAIPRLVPLKRLPAAIALGQLSYTAISVVGPVVGGLIIASVGVPAAFGCDVVTFVAAIGALLAIAPLPAAPDAARPTLSAIAEGLRFAARHRTVLATFVIDLDAMVFGMPAALFPALATQVYHVGPTGYGLLNAAPAVGALVGAALTGWTGRVRHPGRAVFWAVAAWGVAIAAFGLFTVSFPLALLCLGFAGAADVISAVFRNAIVQFETPDALRGRLMSIHTLVVTSGPRIGDVEATAMASLAGLQFSVLSGGLLCLLGLVAVARWFPSLMQYESSRAARGLAELDVPALAQPAAAPGHGRPSEAGADPD